MAEISAKLKSSGFLLEDDYANRYTPYYDDNGNMKYKIKSCIDTFSYSFKETDADTGEIHTVSFSVKEKRHSIIQPCPCRET